MPFAFLGAGRVAGGGQGLQKTTRNTRICVRRGDGGPVMTAFGQLTAFGQNLCFDVLATFGQMCSCIWLGVFLCSVVVVCGIFWARFTFLGVFKIFAPLFPLNPSSPGPPSPLDRPSAGPPKMSLFVSPPATIFILSSLSWGSSRGFLVVFAKRRDPQMCLFGVLGLSWPRSRFPLKNGVADPLVVLPKILRRLPVKLGNKRAGVCGLPPCCANSRTSPLSIPNRMPKSRQLTRLCCLD